MSNLTELSTRVLEDSFTDLCNEQKWFPLLTLPTSGSANSLEIAQGGWAQLVASAEQVHVVEKHTTPYVFALGAAMATEWPVPKSWAPHREIAPIAPKTAIEDRLMAIAREIPDEEWRKIPTDLSFRLDYYLYGRRDR
jgi:hypothetical protein